MSNYGPRPKPTELKLLHGARPARVNHAEPQYPEGPVDRPDWLSDHAQTEWEHIAPLLTAARVLTAADTDVLGLYCESMSIAKRLSFAAARSNPMVRGRDGNPVKNPVFAQRLAAVDQALRLAREFGLTPSARSGIKVEVSFADPASRLLTGNA